MRDILPRGQFTFLCSLIFLLGSFDMAVGGPVHRVNCDKGETIQHKIDEAKAGDVIEVSGTCNENLVIRKEMHDITLDGQGVATIDGPDSTRTTIVIRGKEITVRGFTITGGRNGISITRGSRASIEGNLIDRTGWRAVVVKRNSSARIMNNTIQNNPRGGIFIKDHSRAHIGVSGPPGERALSPNTIVHNSGSWAITVQRTSEALIAGNVISNNSGAIKVSTNSQAHIGLPDSSVNLGANKIEGNDKGVAIERSSFARIIGNTISNTQMSWGIQVRDTSHALIAKNIINNNARHGIVVTGNSSVSLGKDTTTTYFDEPNETVLNNDGFGIRCEDGGYVEGRLGTLNGNRGGTSFAEGCIDKMLGGEKDETLELMVSSVLRFPRSKIQGRQSRVTEGGALQKVDCQKGETIQNKIDGAKAGDVIEVTGTCNENLVLRKGSHNITLDGKGTATIRGADPRQATISVQGKQNTIRGFTITGGNDGISVKRGGRALIDSNVIEGAKGHGIRILRNSSARIFNNTIRNNQGNGISILDNSAARIGVFASGGERGFFPNTITQNGGIGILVRGASEALIAGNTISQNRFQAFFVADNSRVHIGLPDGTENAGANTIEGNDGGGIYLTRSSFARIVGNTIRENGSQDGIQVSDASHAEIAKNIIDNNARHGINVKGSSTVNLGKDSTTTFFDEPNETTMNNGRFGISCFGGSYVKGRIGTISGKRGIKSFGKGCVDGLVQ